MADWVVTLLEVVLETRSGVRVGAPAGDPVGTDSPLLRHPDGRPILPGSSLKGVLRSSAERLLRGVDERLACDVLASPCLGNLTADRVVSDDELERLCWVCRLFGSQHRGGRLIVGDLLADRTTTVVRDGVAIDRNELRAVDRLKFDYEVMPPGTRLSGRLRIDDPEPGDVGLLLGLLDLLDAGVITVGGGATRGLGQVALAELTGRTLSASRWRPGEAGAPLDVDAARRETADRMAREEAAGAR